MGAFALAAGMAGLKGLQFGIENAAAKRAATRDFKRQKLMFDYQNAYNTPANQMKRLKAAGLNPALMYGQGNTGNAQGVPQVAQTKTPQGPDFAAGVASGAQTSLVAEQRGMMRAQEYFFKAQANLENLRATTHIPDFNLRKKLTLQQVDVFKQNINQSKQEVSESQQRISLMQVDEVLKGTQIELNMAQKNVAIETSKKILADTALVNKIIEMDYSDKTGRNIWTNLERVTDGMSTSTGGALGILATLSALRNPAKASQFGSKVATRAKGLYNKLKSALKYKFKMKGWLKP